MASSILMMPLRGPAMRTLISKTLPKTSSPFRTLTTKSSTRPSAILLATPALRQPVKLQTRFFNATAPPAYEAGPSTTQRLVKAGLIFGGTLLALNLALNRDATSSQGGIAANERDLLHSTFAYTGVGVATIGLVAKSLHNMGWSFRLMTASPWVVLGVGLVGSIGTMMATRMTDPENTVQKHVLWTMFNITQGALLAPTFFFHPAIIARAGLYTVGLMGGISFIGATARSEQYLWLGAPLMGGMAVVALSGLAPLVLPATSGALAITEAIWLYGGLTVFGGMTLWDVQKIRQHAQLASAGVIKRDPINECISLELDFINIFIRMVQILAMQQNNKRR